MGDDQVKEDDEVANDDDVPTDEGVPIQQAQPPMISQPEAGREPIWKTIAAVLAIFLIGEAAAFITFSPQSPLADQQLRALNEYATDGKCVTAWISSGEVVCANFSVTSEMKNLQTYSDSWNYIFDCGDRAIGMGVQGYQVSPKINDSLNPNGWFVSCTAAKGDTYSVGDSGLGG